MTPVHQASPALVAPVATQLVRRPLHRLARRALSPVVRRLRGWLAGGLVGAGLLLPAAAGAAVTCHVPSAFYPDVASAVTDPGCNPIVVTSGLHTENLSIGRDVTIQGAGSTATTLAGWVRVTGASTDVVLEALRVDATAALAPLCNTSGLDVRQGARVGGRDLTVVGRPGAAVDCTLHADGFEGGGAAGWSFRQP
jgi:hypothetical protein